jgi:predicted phage-related endonuclease
MKIINVTQGTPAWHAHRATHFNASDAPAMMGCGHKTRSELLLELHTSIARDVSDYVQEKVYDPGHTFERLARPLAEDIIGEQLYPLTGTNVINGLKLSASFDGITLLNDVVFEHKRLNAELRAVFADIDTITPEYRNAASAGRLLPLMYRVQMEHQAMVSDCNNILFMASEWDDDGKLIEERHCDYRPSPKLRAQIVAGWAQLAEDLRTYVPPPAPQPTPTGKAPDTLPALRIEVTGAVTASNLAEFKNTALAAIRSVNRELETDQDFADAEASVKWCTEVESRLAAGKEHALSQTASIDALFKAIDDISAEARTVRLSLEKLVKARKEQIRTELVHQAEVFRKAHLAALVRRLGLPSMPDVPADFAGAIKNKRSLDSLRDALDTELARVKIAANELADHITLNLRTIQAAELDHLFPDLQALTLKQPDDLAAVISLRVANYRRDQENARQQALRADEERKTREAQAATTAATATAAVIGQAASPGPLFSSAPPRQQTLVPAADDGVRIKLGDINALIAPLNISVDGLTHLGFPPVAIDKSARLYRASDFTKICEALINVINQAKNPVATAA